MQHRIGDDAVLAKNLKYLLAQRGLNANSLQDADPNISQPTTQRILTGATASPRDLVVKRYADFFNVSISDIKYVDLEKEGVSSNKVKTFEPDGIALNNVTVWDGEGPDSADAVKVDLYKSVEFAAGDGMCHIDESQTGSIFFSKRSLKNQGVELAHARFVSVTGTSGGERLPKGSVIGYDTSNRRVVDGELYALDHNGQLRVKVLFNQDDGGLKLHSYNEADHPDEFYSLKESREINISGRVFWIAYFL